MIRKWRLCLFFLAAVRPILAMAEAPVLSSISPSTATAGDPAFTLTLMGSNFINDPINGSVVLWNEAIRQTTFISETQLTAAILDSDIASVGQSSITVFNPAPDGGTSDGQLFTVKDPNPAPNLSSIAPSSATTGGPAFTMTLTGSNFIDESVVQWNGASRTTTFVSDTQLIAAILESDIGSVGVSSVTVFNPAPGGGTSNGQLFLVEDPNPVPVITRTNPTFKNAGAPAFSLIVIGTNFISDSIVQWNGESRDTNFVNATRLTASILESDIASVGVASVTVFNPTPGGGASAVEIFPIRGRNPVPTLSSIAPSSTTPGGAGFTLTATGANFIEESVILWNGISRATTFVGENQLTCDILAEDIVSIGTSAVSVFNLGPGGGTSTIKIFTVKDPDNPAPVLSSINPSSATTGDPDFILTLTGSNFIAGSVVRWGGAPRATTFVSTAQLTAAIPASDIDSAGVTNVTVFNPAPGGGTSGAQTFTVKDPNPVPVITRTNPTFRNAGDPAFSLIVIGTNFVSDSIVQWNGENRDTNFVNATRLTASILENDIASVGVASVTVFNPAPGGGTSAVEVFPIRGRNPVPTLSSIAPSSATPGGAGFTLTATGANFIEESVILWNGISRATTFVGENQLTCDILAEDIVSIGTSAVSVFNLGPGGGTSTIKIFTVKDADNPVPVLSSITPSSATTGDPDFILTLTGSNFIAGSVVRWGGAARATTFVSTAQLTAAIPASDIDSAGVANVTVFNPVPGGGTSGAQTFTVKDPNPAPILLVINPRTATVGSPAFSLTVIGSRFVSDSVVQWNGSPRVTTFVSSTRMSASIPASDISAVGGSTVTVFTPLPGGGTSEGHIFNVTGVNPAPTLSSIAPSSATAGGPAFMLTLTGSNFIMTSVVRWNGVDRATALISSTRLTASILASDIVSPGESSITVFNPTPGGGTSSAKIFKIREAPVLQVVGPDSGTAGGPAFTLSVIGNNFDNDSVVQWEGNQRPTTFINSTQLEANISAVDVSVEGIFKITVVSPDGKVSNFKTFEVKDAPPAGSQANTDLTQVRAFPNPWVANRHGGSSITFDRLTPDASVKIFTVSSQWVKSLSSTQGDATWDMTNDAGESVASGYYIYFITDPEGHKSHGKVAIVK